MILPALLLLAAQPATCSPEGPPAIPPVVVPPNGGPAILERALQQVVTPPQPRQSIDSLFSPDDYPPKANGCRAAVGTWLLIDKQGRVVDCSITQPSGRLALDAVTCVILRRRARFTPALDNSGSPSAGAVSVTIDWDKVLRKPRVRLS